ncbi:hypothetical protein [Lysobacter enzymogenes]|uniref:hypothetical protein n=1 Tax=Lysobacter enzymogenes TaxID=69 RepID=UPI0008948FDD|nr:hypothetical protein [Lysobacter enzymogenes]SDX19899.1 hypothetical protein SAMN05421681_104191 [Lysobacter enzymogenes]
MHGFATSRCLSASLCAGALASLLALAPTQAQRAASAAPQATAQQTSAPQPSAAASPGQHDFDFETGLWRTQVRRLAKPLSGSSQWLDYTGTTHVVPLHGGRANLAELAVAGPAGRIDGVALRLYEPATRRWRIHYASLRDGALTAPLAGGFARGRGEFFGADTFDGRPIQVRFRIHCPHADRCLFDQAFSADGGRHWETNWQAVDTRIADAASR